MIKKYLKQFVRELLEEEIKPFIFNTLKQFFNEERERQQANQERS